MPTEEPKSYDEDIDNADNFASLDPADEYAATYATQAQALALISIAKTLRRIELALKDVTEMKPRKY